VTLLVWHEENHVAIKILLQESLKVLLKTFGKHQLAKLNKETVKLAVKTLHLLTTQI